jgi:hypothetical protein
MVVESDDTLAPVELNHHVGVKVGIVLSSWEIVVGLHQSISSNIHAREEVAHLLGGVVAGIAESLNFREPLHVMAVVCEPDSSMESHFVVLSDTSSTISSMALESLEKMLSKTF